MVDTSYIFICNITSSYTNLLSPLYFAFCRTIDHFVFFYFIVSIFMFFFAVCPYVRAFVKNFVSDPQVIQEPFQKFSNPATQWQTRPFSFAVCQQVIGGAEKGQKVVKPILKYGKDSPLGHIQRLQQNNVRIDINSKQADGILPLIYLKKL